MAPIPPAPKPQIPRRRFLSKATGSLIGAGAMAASLGASVQSPRKV